MSSHLIRSKPKTFSWNEIKSMDPSIKLTEDEEAVYEWHFEPERHLISYSFHESQTHCETVAQE